MTQSRGIEVLGQLLASILDAFPYPLYIVDLETYTIVKANRAAGPHVVPGKSLCYQVSHHRDAPCDDPAHLCPLIHVRQHGSPMIVEHVHYDEHGQQRTVEVHAYPIRLEGGAMPYMIEMAIDVTERHRLQEELRRREAELRATLDATPMLVMVVNGERRIRHANRAVAEFVGTRQETLLGQRLGEALHCIHATDDPRGCGFGPACGGCLVRQLVSDTLRQGKPFYQREVTLDMQYPTSLQTRTFWASIVPLFDHKTVTDPTALVALEDITPLKNLLARTQRLLSYQEALHEILASAAHAHDLPTLLETVLDTVMEHMGVAAGAVWVGTDKVVRGVDPSIAEACTRAHQETRVELKDPIVISDIFHDRLSPSLARWAMRAMSPFRLRALLGVPILSEDRCIGGIGVACFEPVRWREEDIVLLSTVGREIGALADRLLLIDQLQRMNIELNEALQMREVVLQNVSHELRTPLTLIKGYVELMRERVLGDLSPDQEEAIEVMQRNVERLQFMIDRLILMRSIRGEPLKREAVDLGQWLTAFVEEWEPIAQEKGFHLDLDLASPLAPVLLDRQLFRQVIDNLLHNAMKFSPQGSTIRIRAWQEAGNVMVAVSDEGIGIPPDRLEKIFEPFYQVDSGLSRRFEGLGIGLALCKQIVELHGGRIWAESEGEGKGATFYIALPV